MGTFADACDAVLSDPGGNHSLHTTLAPLYQRVRPTTGERYAVHLNAITARIPPSTRVVLNAPCGVGRFLSPLAERHGAVVGVDSSAQLLSLAADHVAASGGVMLVEDDVSDEAFDLNRRVDAAACTEYRSAYLSDEELVDALAGMRRHLHDGGTLVVDALADARPLREESPSVFRDNRYTVERSVDVFGVGDGSGDLARVADYRVTDGQTREGAVARERERLRPRSAGHLADAMSRAGFRDVNVEADVPERGALLGTGRV
ncbi:class I SAM-dependent methyltransferase [Halobaculum limi]|uniref:class I SAM-dependent methyltransferase n=1 Tax=Halobaculum limi TaxID=3031916 RepID=UPI0024056A41|nr:class I SAM-dependent methyltransferase [Halobaculum sp. YSMS11]